MRIAMVSEHASPLAVLGGVDAGGQNVHVAALATALGPARRRGRRAHAPRRSRRCRGACRSRPGVEVDHVDAGPPREVPKDELLPYMAAFAARAARAVGGRAARRRPRALLDVGARRARAPRATSASRSCTPSTRSASVKRRHQGGKRHEPAAAGSRSSAASRRRVDRVVATCTDEVFELVRHGRRPAPHHASCRAASTSTRFTPGRPAPSRAARAATGSSPPAGWSSARASATRSPRSPRCPDAELHVAGGPDAAALDARSRGAPPARAGRRARRRATALVLRGRVGRDGDAARCCARPTPSSACRGTSRSASCRSRRWPAACRSSPPRSAARSTPSSTASPACTCRRAIRRRSPRALRELLDRPERRAALGAGRRAARARALRLRPRRRGDARGLRRGRSPAPRRRGAAARCAA